MPNVATSRAVGAGNRLRYLATRERRIAELQRARSINAKTLYKQGFITKQEYKGSLSNISEDQARRLLKERLQNIRAEKTRIESSGILQERKRKEAPTEKTVTKTISTVTIPLAKGNTVELRQRETETKAEFIKRAEVTAQTVATQRQTLEQKRAKYKLKTGEFDIVEKEVQTSSIGVTRKPTFQEGMIAREIATTSQKPVSEVAKPAPIGSKEIQFVGKQKGEVLASATIVPTVKEEVTPFQVVESDMVTSFGTLRTPTAKTPSKFWQAQQKTREFLEPTAEFLSSSGRGFAKQSELIFSTSEGKYKNPIVSAIESPLKIRKGIRQSVRGEEITAIQKDDRAIKALRDKDIQTALFTELAIVGGASGKVGQFVIEGAIAPSFGFSLAKTVTKPTARNIGETALLGLPFARRTAITTGKALTLPFRGKTPELNVLFGEPSPTVQALGRSKAGAVYRGGRRISPKSKIQIRKETFRQAYDPNISVSKGKIIARKGKLAKEEFSVLERQQGKSTSFVAKKDVFTSIKAGSGEKVTQIRTYEKPLFQNKAFTEVKTEFQFRPKGVEKRIKSAYQRPASQVRTPKLIDLSTSKLQILSKQQSLFDLGQGKRISFQRETPVKSRQVLQLEKATDRTLNFGNLREPRVKQQFQPQKGGFRAGMKEKIFARLKAKQAETTKKSIIPSPKRIPIIFTKKDTQVSYFETQPLFYRGFKEIPSKTDIKSTIQGRKFEFRKPRIPELSEERLIPKETKFIIDIPKDKFRIIESREITPEIKTTPDVLFKEAKISRRITVPDLDISTDQNIRQIDRQIPIINQRVDARVKQELRLDQKQMLDTENVFKQFSIQELKVPRTERTKRTRRIERPKREPIMNPFEDFKPSTPKPPRIPKTPEIPKRKPPRIPKISSDTGTTTKKKKKFDDLLSADFNKIRTPSLEAVVRGIRGKAFSSKLEESGLVVRPLLNRR